MQERKFLPYGNWNDGNELAHLFLPEKDVEKEAVVELEEGGVYSQGNVKTLMETLSKITGKESPKVRQLMISHTLFRY